MISLDYPKEIKQLLRDDRNNIQCKKFLKNIPRKNGQRIYDILINYSADFNVKNDEIKKEIINHIRFYFNEALPNVLLYQNEKVQYNMVLKHFNNLAMDQIYGVEHLCRLFTKLPLLISSNDLIIAQKSKWKKRFNKLWHIFVIN